MAGQSPNYRIKEDTDRLFRVVQSDMAGKLQVSLRGVTVDILVASLLHFSRNPQQYPGGLVDAVREERLRRGKG